MGIIDFIDFMHIGTIPHSKHGIWCNWRNNWSGMTFIYFNSIGSQRKHWHRLHGIGWNWWTSSSGGIIDLEWHYTSFNSIGNQKKQWYQLSQIRRIWHSIWIQLGIKEYHDINLFLIQNLNRNHWLVVQIEIEIPWESKETLVWNRIQLVFTRAVDVEWYQKQFHCESNQLIETLT